MNFFEIWVSAKCTMLIYKNLDEGCSIERPIGEEIMITFHRRHESLPKLKGVYQENLATYIYESNELQTVLLNCLPCKLDWSEITLHMDKQDAPTTQEDKFSGDSLTLPNMVCTNVSYSDVSDEMEYQYSLYRHNGQDPYIEAEISLPQEAGLHIGDRCTLTIAKA